MKTPTVVMNRIRLAWAVAVACVVLLGNIPELQAQGSASSRATPTGATLKKDPNEPTWDLDIVDGILRRHDGQTDTATLKAVVSYLRNLYPANVVLAPGVGDINVTDLKLANFDWTQGLEALKVASGEAFLWNKRGAGDTTIDPTTGLPVQTSQSGSDLYVLTPNPEPSSLGSRRSVEVFNLANYLRGPDGGDSDKALANIEMILSETLTELTGASGRGPRLQFHPSAGLLIVIGSPDEIAVASKVILALPEVSSSKGSAGSVGWQVPPGTAGDGAARDAFLRRYGIAPGSPQNTPQGNNQYQTR